MVVRGGGNYYAFENKAGTELLLGSLDKEDRGLVEDFKAAFKQKQTKATAVPSAPFVTDTNAWVKLGMKVALKEAIKQGVDKIAWATGEQQNERYDLSKQISEIRHKKSEGSTGEQSYDIMVLGKDNEIVYNTPTKESKLEDLVGKEMAQKIINSEGTEEYFDNEPTVKTGNRVLSGLDLKVGGKGMIGFYGSPQESKLGIVGNIAKSLFKQEPKTTTIQNGDTYVILDKNGKDIWNGTKDSYDRMMKDTNGLADGETLVEPKSQQHSIDITPQLKAEVQKGLPQFQKANPAKVLIPKDFDIDKSGDNFLFYHYGDIKGDAIDPKFHGKQLYTSDKRATKVSYYYTKSGQRERMVGGQVHVVSVLKSKVYPFNADPLGFYEKAKAEFEKDYPGQSFNAPRQLDYMNPMIAKAGYDMVVAKWDAFPLRAESVKPLKFDKAKTEKLRGEMPANELKDIKEKIANDIRAKAGRATGLGLNVFYKKGIDAVLNDPKLRKLVDKKLLKKYDGLTAKPTIAKERQDILTNTKPEVDRLRALPKEAEDGVTLNLDGTKYTGGGLAVPAGSKNIDQSKLTPEAISDFLEKNKGKQSEAMKPGLYKFPNDTKMSIDLNIVAPREHVEVAKEFGRLAGQKSLYDLDSGKYVETGATGEKPMTFTDEQFKEIGESLAQGKLPMAVQAQKANEGKRIVQEEDKFTSREQKGNIEQGAPKEAISAPITPEEAQTPIPPEKPPETTETAPTGKEQREKGFFKRIMEGTTPTKDLKEAIEEKGLTYTVLNNNVTRKNVDYVIAELGPEKAWKEVKDKNSALNGATRSGVSERLVVLYDKLATEAEKDGDMQSGEEYRDKALEIAEWKDEYGRDAGQFNQYSGSDECTSLMSPKTNVVRVKKKVAKQRAKKIEDSKEDIKEKKESLRKANKDSLEILLGSEAYQKIKDKISKAKKEVKETTPEVLKEKIKREQTYRVAQWDVFKNAGKGTLSSTAAGLTKEQIEAIGNIVASYVREGVYRTEDLVKRLQEDWLKYTGQELDAKEAEKLLPSKVVSQLTKGKIKELGIDLDKIVRQHYTVVDATGRTLVDKLVEDAGLTGKDAETLGGLIQSEFNKIATEKKRKILLGNIKARANKVTEPKKAKAEWEKLVELTNLGAFSSEEFSEAYADSWGFPKLSPEQIKEIERLADVIQSKEGFKRDEAVKDYLNYIANLNGIDLGDVAMGWWYASILSGERTQAKNFFGNLINTIFEAGIGTIYNVGKGDFKIAQAMWTGLLNAGSEAWTEAKYTFSTGYSPVRFNKIEAGQTLERWKLKGGWFNPVNYAKYVGRFMSATDAFFYVGLKEMRAHELAMREARKLNAEANVPSAQDWAKACEILFGTKQRKAEAEIQATDEGLKGIAKKKRVYEIMEQTRGEGIVTESNNFASRGTYNYRPEGGLGMITEAIAHSIGSAEVHVKNPFTGKSYTVGIGKFFVPFTRIIANVGNTALDYTPIGLMRAGTGKLGSVKKSSYYRKLTGEERARTLIKAVIGTSAAAMLWFLSEPPDDDKEPTVMITAKGTGDYAKNMELKESPEGWQQYSIRVGGKWFSYQYTPLFLILAPIGLMRDTQRYKKDKAETMKAFEVAAGGMSMFMSALSDMTALSTTSGLLSAISSGDLGEFERFWKKMGASTIKGFIYPKAVEQTKQMINDFHNDPQRYSSTLFGKMIKDMPVIQNWYPIQYNFEGEEVVFDAVQMFEMQGTRSPYVKYILDNGTFIGMPNQKDQSLVFYDDKLGVERGMNDREYMQFVQISAREIKNRIMTELMPRTDLSSDDIKKEITNIKSEVRKQTKATLFGWTTLKKDHPTDWNKMVEYGVVPIPQDAVEVPVDGKKTRLDKAQTERFNDKAVEYYRQEVSPYLNDTKSVEADKRDIDEETGDSYFIKYIRDTWVSSKADAKLDMEEELIKK